MAPRLAIPWQLPWLMLWLLACIPKFPPPLSEVDSGLETEPSPDTETGTSETGTADTSTTAVEDPLAALSDEFDSVTGLWSKNGCRIDPNGYCIPATIENGCVIDPSGQCVSEPITTKNGCIIDPNGLCRP